MKFTADKQEQKNFFHEEQKLSIRIRAAIIICIGAVIVIESFAIKSIFDEGGFDSLISVFLIVLLGIGMPAGIGFFVFVSKLETEVRSNGIYLRYYPFHLHCRIFDNKDLSAYYARKYRPIVEYGGWGIRFGTKGQAYNISGNEGIQLVFKNGKRLLIGSQRAEEFVQAVTKSLGASEITDKKE
jgi:hypothetical protein